MIYLYKTASALRFISALCLIVILFGGATIMPCELRAQNSSASNRSFTSRSLTSRAVVVRPYSVKPSRAALDYANAELKRMSLDEKIGQLISVGVNAAFLNRESAAYKELQRQVEQNHIGGIILFRSPVYEAAVLMNRMQKLSTLR